MSAGSWAYWTNNINVHPYKSPCVLLKVTPFYTEISALCAHELQWWALNPELCPHEGKADCVISVKTDRSVDRHQYHHQEWHLCTILFPWMHGRVFPQRTDIFQTSMQSKPLWTKQIKWGAWIWPGLETSAIQSVCGNCSPPSQADRAGLWNKEQRGLVSCLMFLSIVSSDL